jgi:hypothetical protein
MDYDIVFFKDNSNAIEIFLNGKSIYVLVLPPTDKGCDIINFSDTLCKGYTYDFDGLILITTKSDRKIYYKGDLVAETKR